RHARPPDTIPAWVSLAGEFSGTLVQPDSPSPGSAGLVVRAVVLTQDRRRAVVADLPVDDAIVQRLQARTGAVLREVSATGCGPEQDARDTSRALSSLFRETVSFMD